jgi:hypothetical protein
MATAEVSNKRVILKQFVTGFPTEDDMELVTGSVRLVVPPGAEPGRGEQGSDPP